MFVIERDPSKTTTTTTTSTTTTKTTSKISSTLASTDDDTDTSSGYLRRLIGPTKKRLFTYIVEATSRRYDYGEIQDMKQLQKTVGGDIEHCTRDLNRVKTTVKLLEDYHAKWLNLIIALEGEKLALEKSIYEKFANGETGIFEGISASYELVADLETRLDSLNRYSAKVDQQIQAKSPAAPQSSSSSIVPPANPALSEPPRPKFLVTPSKPPEWDGDILKYQAWRALYCPLVHDNKELTTIEKLFVLTTQCLTKDAKKLVEGYQLVDENYEVIWKMLENRFNDSNLLKQTLNTELIKMRRCGEKTFEVRKTFEQIERILRQLEGQKIDVDNSHIETLIETKLPQWVLDHIVKQKIDDPAWSVGKLRAAVEKCLKTREEVERVHRCYDPRPTKPEEKPKPNPAYPTSALAVVNDRIEKKGGNQRNQKTQKPNNPKSTTESKKCDICGEEHGGNNCPNFPTHDAIYKKLAEDHKCYKCFIAGHRSKACRKKVKCSDCGKFGHQKEVCRGATDSTGSGQKRQTAAVVEERKSLHIAF